MSEAQQAARQAETLRRVGEYLGELFDEPFLDPETDHYYVGYGSTVLEISVEPYGPDETVIRITAYCVQNVDVQAELAIGLLGLNHEVPFGAFELVGNDIFYSHALFGRGLNRKSLLGAIAAVATTSDDYDDRIVQRYGGNTALELIQETGGRKRRRSKGA
ncbi:MAG: YbjN domain-containing protein [Acidobacteriota bacterium]|nr:YbjN domain-containing protein [Acidobacteriota bacterium]MDH3524106.1 YbjN domain-containing protein [Acidobacteriota bacterium]